MLTLVQALRYENLPLQVNTLRNHSSAVFMLFFVDLINWKSLYLFLSISLEQ